MAFGRYKQLKYYIRIQVPNLIATGQVKASDVDQSSMDRLDRNNFIASLVAYVNCFNLFMIGNFRCSEAYTLHTIGAALLFTGILLYGYYMVGISNELSSKFQIESWPLTMGVTVAIGLVSFLTSIIVNLISIPLFGSGNYFDDYTRLHWNSEQPGYWLHVLSTAFEWITIHTFPLLCLCSCRRMKTFEHWDKVQF